MDQLFRIGTVGIENKLNPTKIGGSKMGEFFPNEALQNSNF